MSSNKKDNERRRMSAAFLPGFGDSSNGDKENQNRKSTPAEDPTSSTSSTTTTTTTTRHTNQKQNSMSLFGRLTSAASGKMYPHSDSMQQSSTDQQQQRNNEKNKLQCPPSSRFTRRADSECSLRTSTSGVSNNNNNNNIIYSNTRSQALQETERDTDTCHQTLDQSVRSEQVRNTETGRANSAANISVALTAIAASNPTTTVASKGSDRASNNMIEVTGSGDNDNNIILTPSVQSASDKNTLVSETNTNQGGIDNGRKQDNHINKKADAGRDDEDDQVIPLWPSRSEASSIDPSEIQFKVYSLKDYSQVASPTIASAATSSTSIQNQSTSSGGGVVGGSSKLLKSLSQDRKIRSNTKRMSECLPATTSMGIGRRYGARSDAIESGYVASTSTTSGMAAFEDGSHMDVPFAGNEAAADTTSTGGKHNNSLAGESRIDRMRKLFVSPLSLRSGSSATSSTILSSPAAGANKAQQLVSSSTQHASTSNPRLSFQSGASIMLNKPQHLMHVMYRTRAGAMHHRRSPMRQKQMGKSFRVYGCPLQVANNIYPITCFGRPDIYRQQSVPYVLARLCNYIEENSSKLTHEGIFRVSGNARLMEKLRTLFDHLGDAPLESESVDVATSASMLKMYLRELPEPLIPARMNYHFIALAKKYSHLLSQDSLAVLPSDCSSANFKQSTRSSISITSDKESSVIGDQAASERQRLAFLRDLTKLVRKLPIENYNLLKYLACFLYRVSLKQRYNKMCAKALGIVFGPNVFRIRSESYKGLKEQELSNQIMASIISNYRSIFDCELTDPLGNLVDSDTDEPSLKNDKPSSTVSPDIRTKASGSSNEHRADSSSKSSLVMKDTGMAEDSEKAGCASTKTSSTSRLPATGEMDADSDGDDDFHHECHYHHDDSDHHPAGVSCCAKHCSVAPGPPHQVSDADLSEDEEVNTDDSDGDDDDDEDLGDDDDDIDDLDVYDPNCADEDESYSPSSESGSYCSSIDSDSLESSYDGAMVRPRRYHEDREDDLDLASQSNLSTSECGSDTSYTPSSTQSEFDHPIDKDAGTSSLYSSRSSSTRLGAGAGEGREADDSKLKELDRQQGQNQQGPCKVCKRRRSQAQITDSTVEAVVGETEIGESADRESAEVGGKSKTSPSRTDKDSPTGDVLASSQQQHPKIIADNEPDKRTGSIATALKQPSHQSTKPKRRYEGVYFPRVPAPAKDAHHNLGPHLSAKHDGVKGSHHHQISKPYYEQNLMRRRSSSASSLTRMKSKRNQLIAHNQHGRHLVRDDMHHKSSRGHSDRRSRFHHQELRAYGSSRRARNRSSHFARKSAHGEHGSCRRSGSTKGGHAKSHYHHHHYNNRASFIGGQHRGRHHDELAIEPNEAMQNLGKDLIWGYMDQASAEQYIGDPLDRYMMLKSYSDDTLLRSINYETDFPRHAMVQRTRTKRRFSGYDFDSHKGNIIPYCHQVKEIYEDASPDRATTKSKRANTKGHFTHVPKLFDHSAAQFGSPTPVETSIISLLDSRLITGFRPSELSISDIKQDDPLEGDTPILQQVQATKDVIKALRRLMKLGLVHGYDKVIKSEIFPWSFLLSESDLTENELYASCIDHLASKSLAENINENCNKFEMHLNEPLIGDTANSLAKKAAGDEFDADRINSILIDRLNQLKRRYNDLKNIRNHYIKHHLAADESLSLSAAGHIESDIKFTDSGDIGPSHERKDSKVKRPSVKLESYREGSFSDQELAGVSKTIAPGSEQVEGERKRSNSAVLPRENRRNYEDDSHRVDSDHKSRAVIRQECKYGSICPLKFVFNIEKRLALKQRKGSRAVKLIDMSLDQLQAEKLELQKNLLRYEHWFGRPLTRFEYSIVGHLYERYRAIKLIIKQHKQTAGGS